MPTTLMVQSTRGKTRHDNKWFTIKFRDMGERFQSQRSWERARNCIQIDKYFIESIVKCIENYLLQGLDGQTWYGGRIVHLCEVIQLIPSDKLKHLKSEYGGIQTLLKNIQNIFKCKTERYSRGIHKQWMKYTVRVNQVI